MMAERLRRVLTTDPGTGVMRHADAGYPEALEAAAEMGIDLPMAGRSVESGVAADFILRHAGELVTLAPAAVAAAGADALPGDDGLGVIADGALAARDGRIVWVGREAELGGAVEPLAGAAELDAGRRLRAARLRRRPHPRRVRRLAGQRVRRPSGRCELRPDPEPRAAASTPPWRRPVRRASTS